MNFVGKTLWRLLVLLCLLMLVTGCGKKMVKSDAASDHFAQSGERVTSYGQMPSLSSIMKDGLGDGENVQLGEMAINPLAKESESGVGQTADAGSGGITEHSLVASSSTRGGRHGSINDGSSLKDAAIDVISRNRNSTSSGQAGGGMNERGEANGFVDGRQSDKQLSQKGVTFSHGLRDVHFDFDSWRLSDTEREILEANAEWLKAHPHEHVTIEGHCDERGTQSYNYVLGEKRATMVHQYLTFLGVPMEQLYVASFGKDRPACRTMTMDCFDQNRRAHFSANVNMVSQQPHTVSR